VKFSIFQESRQGTRSNNEDRVGYAYSREALLMVVADGMGGHLHGEVASHITVQFLLEAFRREAMPTLPDPGRFLEHALVRAHHAIIDYSRGKRLPETPKTTCVACVVQDGFASWAHAGDSRLYLLREGKVSARTRDHSLIQQLVDAGKVREESIQAHPERNKILNCLGSSVPPRVEVSQRHMLHAGDTLLLCTDGFWGPLPANALGPGLAREDVTVGVPPLLNAAEARAGRDCDNLSVVAITWAENAPTAPHQVSTRTQPLNEVSTRMEEFGAGEQLDMTDEEIERAIAEIREAILRNTGGTK
jgi:serine/threonine protein phosphatase PrpC